MRQIKTIQKRIDALHIVLKIELVRAGRPYSELPEKEKIPLRVIQAEIFCLSEYLKTRNPNFDKILDYLIEKEQYCGAEGLKRAMNFLNQPLKPGQEG